VASQHITKCISYEVVVVKGDLLRGGKIEQVDYVRFGDPDTSEEWHFLAEPENRIVLIEKLAEGIVGADRTRLIQALTKVEIATSIPGGTT
jgi:hypothetical protein